MSSASELPVAGRSIRVEFPDGLVGLPDLVGFSLAVVPETVFYELVSSDEPAFGVVLARADDVRPGMSEALGARGLVGATDDLLVILAVHGEPPAVTANLAGPIVLGVDGRGRQLVVEDPDYPLRAPVAAG
jgi:flagellar assembly factor FliW